MSFASKIYQVIFKINFASLYIYFGYFLFIQVQQGSDKVKYKGPGDVIKKLYAEGGIRSIYKGTIATLLRGKFPFMFSMLIFIKSIIIITIFLIFFQNYLFIIYKQ